jgi:D-threonate/D-erythronate kinase
MADGPRVLIVADDLTGAMDTAGPFAERGLRTSVVAEPLKCDLPGLRSVQVLSLDTGSRHLPPADAARRVAQCVGRFGNQSFDVLFKKIDSTLRGNVVSETLALLKSCGRNAALVAPAFPAQGRTVRDGIVHVNGTPLPETNFARDTLSPSLRRPLTEVFGEAVGPGKVGGWSPAEAQVAKGRSIVIADAETDADLAAALDTARPQFGRMLLVGSAGLGNALARSIAPGAGAVRQVPMVSGPIVFVVGSRAVQSREQVARLQILAGTAVHEAPNGVNANGATIPASPQIAIVAVPDATSGDGDAAAVAHALAQTALDTVRRTGSQALVATGGDTAIAILSAAGCTALEVLGDLMPGLPYARVTLGGKALWFVTKAGGFGGRDTLYEIALRLRGGVRTVERRK